MIGNNSLKPSTECTNKDRVEKIKKKNNWRKAAEEVWQ